MPELNAAPPEGTPTWIDLGIPDLDRAIDFYGAVFGWEFAKGPAEAGYYTMCLLRGRPVAAMMPNQDSSATEFWWNVYFAVDDCATTADKIQAAGGELLMGPMQVMDQGTMAMAKDPSGAQFGVWQADKHLGAEIVNEPNSLLRNDLVTAQPDRARDFYAQVFDFTLDGDENMPDADFTFLRRPDGHEIGGIMGDPQASRSHWGTLFAVDDCDAAVDRIRQAGGTAEDAFTMVYGRMSNARDPFGAAFSVGGPSAPSGKV